MFHTGSWMPKIEESLMEDSNKVFYIDATNFVKVIQEQVVLAACREFSVPI
jgi:hypothetical protein